MEPSVGFLVSEKIFLAKLFNLTDLTLEVFFLNIYVEPHRGFFVLHGIYVLFFQLPLAVSSESAAKVVGRWLGAI